MPGRYLLGLGPVEETASFLRRQTHLDIEPEVLARLDEKSRRLRALRPNPDVILPVPLSEGKFGHVEAVRNRPLFRKLFVEKERRVEFYWVDIPSLIPVQPHVSFDFSLGLAHADMSDDDVLELCLPTRPKPLEVWGGVTAASPNDSACTILTHDLNVLVSETEMDTEHGLKVTFTIGKTAVFCQVQQSGDRYFLRDGTHRAIALMAQGIRKMPCIVEYDVPPESVSDFFPPGVLFGSTPPRLGDFFEQEHYIEHPWQERTKIIRIKVDEFVAPW